MMNAPQHTGVPPPPLSRLLATVVLAVGVAALLLVTVVFPAEYGIDVSGVGRRLGLTAIASPRVEPIAIDPHAPALSPVQQGPVGSYASAFRYDAFEVTLDAYQYVEYKYHLQEGATMLYTWHASAPVRHQLHGHPVVDGATPAEKSFDGRDRQEANGAFTAPFTGLHGWYWENPGADPIRIRITSAGFYDTAVEIRSDRTRHPKTLRTADTLPMMPDGATPAVRNGEADGH